MKRGRGRRGEKKDRVRRKGGGRGEKGEGGEMGGRKKG